MKENLRLLDLFSGVGGFSLAFKREFPNGKIVGFSEIDKYAIQIYKQHFPEVKELGDITTISERELPDFDICTFGFPCQDLSIAGKRKGFDGQRSSLFYQAIRIINAKRPKYFIFENVKGLYSSRKGEDFIQVLQAITDIGYNGQWQLLNTKWFLPQNRERIYFVGHLREESRPKTFPIGENNIEISELQRQQNDCVVNAIKARHAADANGSYIIERQQLPQNSLIQLNQNKAQGYRVYSTDGISQTLTGEGGGFGAKTGLYAVQTFGQKTLNETLAKNPLLCGEVKALDLYNQLSRDNCPTLSAPEHNSIRLFDGDAIRRLTPTECERLQGYPDNHTQGISDSQRYKCLGNSITVNVAQEIFKRLKEDLSKK